MMTYFKARGINFTVQLAALYQTKDGCVLFEKRIIWIILLFEVLGLEIPQDHPSIGALPRFG